ncbi:MAG: 50S ribosome-binding GTPase [Planctomycetaceae bacterium]|jgi:tRNA modification GTPase|nr:50S ribosome-binding GTPase [Planctomycetaceae bacterium]
MLTDTIAARCSASGAAYRGIVRLSGTNSLLAVKQLTGNGELPSFSVLRCQLSVFSSPLPARIFYWREGTGYTGEEAAEIHTAGSPPLLDAIVQKLIETKTVRLAEPGEFTQRAFLNGRIDLMQAEAVLGVIDAANPAALRSALNQLSDGGLPSSLKKIREQLIDTLADIEAAFEFPEEDIEFITPDRICRSIQEALNGVEEFQKRIRNRFVSNEKPVVVLYGAPNTGKSTLFNLLAGQDKAIVSPVAGTTRDYLEADVNFGGIVCKLFDTAGVDELIINDGQGIMNEIDTAAVNLSKQILDCADVVIHCRENGNPNEREWSVSHSRLRQDRWGIWRKDSSLSTINEQLSTCLKTLTNSDAVESTAVRCRSAVDTAVESLCFALQLCSGSPDESLLAAELRNAVNALGLIDGSVYTEDILDTVFSKFCIGK